MLVLSRKQDQSVHFPNLGIKVEILSVNGKTVKVGVDAPREIAVLRGEIAKAQEQQSSQGPVANESTSNESTSNESKQKGSQERHELRNRLHTAKLALHMLQRQLDLGDSDRAEKSLTRALTALGRLDEMAAGPVSVRKDLGKEGACRALVVEDNANERQLMKGFLEMCGYQVDAVEDGYAALGYLAENQHPDIVLLDVNMPGLDGPSTVTAIRNNPAYSGIKLFMVSGEDRESVNVSEGDSGIQQWFSKPLEPNAFAKDLAKIISIGA